jgi:alkylation response protein AidB-like acyl-CoA dehydrogenase
LLLEEIAAGDGAISTMVSVHNAPTRIVVNNYGIDAQKERWLRKLATGEHVGSFGVAEAQAGSDASNQKTRAVKKGDRDVIDGSKQFIGNASHLGSLVFFAASDPAAGKKGLSAFLIEKNHPGFSVTRIEEKLGQKASDTCALAFDAMEVPEDQRIGAEGYRIALSTLESGDIGIAAPQSIGMARAALAYALGYARDRKAFGSAIADSQAVGFRLAETKTRLEAARQLTLHAARLKAEGRPALEAACTAKLFASETAEAVCTAAIQTLGGYGFLADYPVERTHGDVCVCQIYERTSEVQKMIQQRML